MNGVFKVFMANPPGWRAENCGRDTVGVAVPGLKPRTSL